MQHGPEPDYPHGAGEADPAAPQVLYAQRAERFKTEADEVSARFNRFANLRAVAFVASATCLVWGIAQPAPVALGAGLLFGAGFVLLVRHHRALGLRRDRAAALARLNTEARARLERCWQQLPLRHAIEPDPAHAYAADLDLFGHASLLHLLLDTTRTALGQATLAGWLLEAAPEDSLRERQLAVAELAACLDFHQDLEACGALQAATRPDPERWLAWAESEAWLVRRPALLWASRVSPVLLCGFGVAHAVGLLSWPAWLPLLLANLVLWQVLGHRPYATLTRIGGQDGAFFQLAAALDLLSTSAFKAPLLKRLLLTLSADGRSAAAHMRQLERTTRFIIPRSAQVYWVVQAVFLWDVHVLAALEGWQSSVGPRAREWLETLGELEALGSLAALAHAHPGWATPVVEQSASRIDATRAGHPLLAPESRVDNDFRLGPSGTFLLVTGSNMAGKSTFLRTIGLNIVLAQAGGPVCAGAFRMPPLALHTSMRVVDSLERGVSTFLAEVLRLKQVADAARQTDRGRGLCYLLDELLQGTNTAERQIAARRVIRFLLARGAIGAVSTHDLSLADSAEFAAAAQCVSFSETLSGGVDGPTMTFNYRLEPGLARSTNALRLLELLGLEEG